VEVGKEDGVPKPSVANLDSVRLVERSRLVKRVGVVRRGKMGEICRALSIAAGCS